MCSSDLKKDGKSKADIIAIDEAKAAEIEAAKAAEPVPPTTEDLLKQIIELLEKK